MKMGLPRSSIWKEFAVGPGVGAVVGHEDRDVADDLHVLRGGVRSDGAPLFEELILHVLVRLHLLRVVAARLVHGGRRATGDVVFPRVPRRAAVRVLQRHEERVVVEPVRVLGAELQERFLLGVGGVVGEAHVRMPQDALLELDHLAEEHAIVGERPRVGQLLRLQRVFGDQRLQVDQQRVAGEGAEALIRRIAVAGGPERQHLPQPDAGFGEEVHELAGIFAQVADAESAGQGGRVQQYAAGACQHGVSWGNRE